MTRRLFSLLLTLGALAACNDKPPGELVPIPRPSDYKEPPKTEAGKAAAPAVDPNKVTLRWNLAPGAPVAYRLDGTPDAATLYVLERPKDGDLIIRLAAQGAKAAQDQGTFSERGFVMDGLKNVDRNMATLVLELPKNTVGVGDTWSLGTDLLDVGNLGRNFVEKNRERRNTVKLVAVAPEGDDRVVTLEYDLLERVSGIFPASALESDSESGVEETSPIKAPKEKAKGKGKGKEPAKPQQAGGNAERSASAEVTFTGRGEFLVKAGHWRSWEGTLSSKIEGYTAPSPDKSPVQVLPGTLKLKLTALDSVPAELQPEAKK